MTGEYTSTVEEVEDASVMTVEHRLTGGIEEDLVRKRSGLKAYLKHNREVVVTFFLGTFIVFDVFLFTYWLASQNMLECPGFNDCHISPVISWIRDHISMVQGLVTFFYLAGLAGIGYTACCLCEAGLWAVLSRQPLKIIQLESFIAVAQGSLASVPHLFAAIKSIVAGTFLLLVVVSSLTPSTGALVVGYAFERVNVTIPVTSSFASGGGIAMLFRQQNPPVSIQGAAVSLYTAYSRGISIEPMKGYRDWYVNRKALSVRGNMTVNAIRMQTEVSCRGVALQQINIPEEANGLIEFPSNVGHQNSRGPNRDSSDSVQLRSYPALSVFADDFAFKHENRTSASLIFASLNGTIESGSTSLVKDKYIATVSAIKCDIDIEFIDDRLVVGDGGLPAPIATLSSNHGLQIGHCNSSSIVNNCSSPQFLEPSGAMRDQPNTLNELILWFTMAPILAGVSVNGTMPTWQSQAPISVLPLAYTTSDVIKNTWTIAEIETFINVSISALAIATSTNFADFHDPLALTSTVYTSKLSRDRTPLLFIPPSIMMACVIALALLNWHQHNRYSLPVMRGTPLRELLRSMHTRYMHGLIDPDARNWHCHGTLGDVAVMFGVIDVEGGDVDVGFGHPNSVREFGTGIDSGLDRGRKMSDITRRTLTTSASRDTTKYAASSWIKECK